MFQKRFLLIIFFTCNVMIGTVYAEPYKSQKFPPSELIAKNYYSDRSYLGKYLGKIETSKNKYEVYFELSEVPRKTQSISVIKLDNGSWLQTIRYNVSFYIMVK